MSYRGAKKFVAASTQSLNLSTAVVTTFPLTLACRFKFDALPTGGSEAVLLALCNTARNDRFWICYSDLYDSFYCDATANGTIFRKALNSSGIVVGKWYSAAATYPASGSQDVYLDNVAGTLGAGTAQTPAGLNDTRVGGFIYSGGNYGNVNAEIADVAIYNAALSVSEVALYTSGVSPLRIRRANLVSYLPFINGSVTDVVGNRSYKNNGGVSDAALPPLAPLPSRRLWIQLGAASGGAGTDAAIAGTQNSDVGAITAEATTAAAITGTQDADVGTITAEATTGAAIAGVQAPDVGAITAEATTGAAIAGTQDSDVAALEVTAGTGSTDAEVAGTQAPDVGAITVEATLGLTLSATQASDVGYIVVEATLPASMAGTQDSDVAAITVTAAGTSIWTDIGATATTWTDEAAATTTWTDL